MTLYRVKLIEKWQRTVGVQADSMQEALEKAQAAAENTEGELDFHSDTSRDTWEVKNLETGMQEQ